MEKLPEDKTVYVERGLVYQDMGNHKYAIADFQKALEIDIDYEAAWYLSGVSKLKSGLVNEAIEDFLQAQLRNDQLAGVYDGLAQCYHALGNYEESLENFQKALVKSPHNVEFLRNRSECYYDQKMYAESANDLNQALTLNPTCP